jgi:D-glycerate 3-kinase
MTKKTTYLPVFTKLVAGIPDPFIEKYYDAVFTVAEIVAKQYQGSMLTVGVGGAQGSGKSTMARMIQRVIQDVFSMSAEVLSIDDFYLTHEERVRLGRKIHPMLAVRGVPGTHDMQRMCQTIEALGAGAASDVPVFSKGEDDRLPEARVVNPPQVLILEGWCWGASAGDDEALQSAVNTLEAEQDPQLLWRRYVNEALASGVYQQCFNNDVNVFLAVPDMESVFRWRLQQEQEIVSGKRVMSSDEVRTFIMHYQRITEQLLSNRTADIDIQLRPDHSIDEVTVNG